MTTLRIIKNNSVSTSIVLSSFFLIFIFLLTGKILFAQAPCISDEILQKQIQQNPKIQEEIDWFNQYANNYSSGNRTRGVNDTLFIPVVFHVFHQNGSENISDAQLKDQIRVLNLDYMRLNPDTSKSDPAKNKDCGADSVFNFKHLNLGANMKIQFRIATKDPQGNCTNGIIRVFTPMTLTADDNIKKLSGWPTDKYLNIWVVKTIKNITNEFQGGKILGYAQFPFPSFFEHSFSDGVIILADYIGTIGTSDAVSKAGRVATHEIGHWFGLAHPFQGACEGGDQVLDTPPVSAPNFGCPTSSNTCHGDNPDFPDMVRNYMDYADGACQNIFTKGQRDRVYETIETYRNTIFSAENLKFTGIETGTPTPQCSPIAAFDATISTTCEGSTVIFSDYSYNSKVTGWNWSFPGGNPSSSTSSNPTVTYASSGTYPVTLTVENTNGSSTITKNNYVSVLPATAPVNAISQDMESLNFPYNWTLTSTGPHNWERTSQAKNNGVASMVFYNTIAEDDNKISILSPAINLSAAPSKALSFFMAYTPRLSTLTPAGSPDRLTVFVSTNCGKTWASAFSKSGTQLNTLPGLVTSGFFNDFFPSRPDNWKLVTVDLSSFGNSANVIVKIEFTSKGGHNIFIDDVNLGFPTGIEQTPSLILSSLDIFPNPASESATVKFEIDGRAHVELAVFDVMGRKIISLLNETVTPGEHEVIIQKHQFSKLTAGTYFVEMKTPGQVITKKLVVL